MKKRLISLILTLCIVLSSCFTVVLASEDLKWINSSGHRKNMLTSSCDELGVGVYGAYATQNFGKKIFNL